MDELLCKMPCVAIDVETTGLGHAGYPPREDAVLQIGLAWREKGRVGTWSEFCNPGEKFIANNRAKIALQINGISPEVVRSSRPAKTVAQEFRSKVDEIEDSTGSPAEFLAYNKAFDSGFLNQKPWEVPAHKWGDCVMQAAASKLVAGKRLKLERAMQMLEIQWPGKRAHDAAFDAHAALLVHEKITG